MRTSKTIRGFERLKRSWSRCRAPLGSVVLHAALVAALMLLKPAVDPRPAITPGIIVVDMILFDEAADGTGGQVPVADAMAAEPELAAGDGEQPTQDDLAPTAVADLEPLEVREPRVEPLDPEAALARVPTTDAALPTSAEAPTAPAAEPRDAVDDDLAAAQAEPRPLDVTTTSPEAELLANVPDSAPLSALEPLPTPAVAALDAVEQEMLDERFAVMSTDLDALTAEDLVWEHDGRRYAATVTRVGSEDSMGMENVLVSVSTERDGGRWSTKLRMKRLAFSSFAQFVDRWDSSVQIHDDVIDGRFHSNSEIYISRTRRVQPSFRGKVTTARRINTSNSERLVRRDEVFLGGLETRVPRIDIPDQFVAPDSVDAVPAERVHRFDTSTRIVFYMDGSFGAEPLEGGAPMRRVSLSDEPHYLLGGADVSFRVSGIVNGKVLVYAPDDIVIAGDLLYADHPRFDPEADDFAGLVADRNVVVGASRLTGQGDLTIHAAIYAKRRFVVRHYNSGGGYTLRVFGSLAAGSLSPTEPRFRTRLEFDPRLEDARPPGFPVTDRFEVIEWDRRWTEEWPGATG